MEVPTLNKILNYNDLRNLKVGDEVLLMRGRDGSPACFTVHGKVQSTLKPPYWLTLEDYIQIPVKIRFDPNKPDDLLDFLRGLNDPRYIRQSEPKVYNLDLRDFWEMYSVNS